jgi:hypothetical protein
VAVLSMSKQEFGRLDVLLRVQSGRLRGTDACVLISLQAAGRSANDFNRATRAMARCHRRP